MRLTSRLLSVAAIAVAFGFGAAPAFASTTSNPGPWQGTSWGNDHTPPAGDGWQCDDGQRGDHRCEPRCFPWENECKPPCVPFTWSSWNPQWNWNFCLPPVPRFKCVTKILTFNFPHGTAVLTEVSGPVLEQGESAIYRGDLYTIENPHWTPWGTRFEVTKSGQAHVTVNLGPSIWDGKALLPCA